MKHLLLIATLWAPCMLYADGGDVYSPTQLEWVTLELRARNPMPSLNMTGVWLDYNAIPPNTINILIAGLSKVKNPELKKRYAFLAENQKNMANKIAKDHGWTWLQTTITNMDGIVP